eukprot:sb/3478303/
MYRVDQKHGATWRYYRGVAIASTQRVMEGQSLFVILEPFGELRHNKGFPLALYSYGVSRNTKKIFHSNRALTKNSNFALDWGRDKNEDTKMCRMSDVSDER